VHHGADRLHHSQGEHVLQLPYVSGTTKTLPSHFADTSRRLVEAYGVKPGSLVVDIGSNDGTWLKQYAPFDLRVLGVEPASNVADLANAAGVNTWNRFFNEETADLILEKEGKADLVTAAGVFFTWKSCTASATASRSCWPTTACSACRPSIWAA
jgi:cyclopropane fatty-acyl-phospholipid synthase-like methyltransferase